MTGRMNNESTITVDSQARTLRLNSDFMNLQRSFQQPANSRTDNYSDGHTEAIGTTEKSGDKLGRELFTQTGVE